MAESKNSQEKQELFKIIWSVANDLRGSVDGWDFKNYVLGTLFYRYLSEKLDNLITKQERESNNNVDFKYSELSDGDISGEVREGVIKDFGFFLYPSELFCNVVKHCRDNENLNEQLSGIFRNIENSAMGDSKREKCFKGLFNDFDVNSNKLGGSVNKRNERLVSLLTAVANMNFGEYTENTVDLLGDAYEYLMTMYASNAGKSGGEFFTPQEVSTLLTKICIDNKTKVKKVYDPTCGSGSLLLKAAKILGKDNVELGYFGQEINVTTYNLCRINMFLHNIDYTKFNIENEDTLIHPKHLDDEPFDVIVSNPPYSVKWSGDDDVNLINDKRFSPASVLAPKSKADLAFVMHCLSWLSNDGIAAIVCFPGVLYRNGAEQKIRKYLVKNNFIDCIIQLPSNLFFGTSIATCIMVLKKDLRKDNSVLFIDASNEFIKETKNNRLSNENIENILNIAQNREEMKYVSRLVDFKEIEENKFNLSVNTYVEKEDTREKIDIKVLNAEIDEIVKREEILRKQINEIIRELE